MVSRLHAPVGGDHEVPGQGFDVGGDEGAGGGDEAVHQHRLPLCGGTEDQTGDSADLESTQFRKNIDWIAYVGGIGGYGLFDHGDLVDQLPVVDPRAPAGNIGDGGAGVEGDDGAAGRGVADPHLSRSEDVGLRSQFPGDLDPRLDGLHGLSPGHGGSPGHVHRPQSNFFVNDPAGFC